jgi:hypothetical protein
VLYQRIDLHLEAVKCGLITSTHYYDLVKQLEEIGRILEGLPLATAQFESLQLGIAVYSHSNSVAAFCCVSKKRIPGVPPGLPR